MQQGVGRGAGHDVGRLDAGRKRELAGVVLARDLEVAQAVALLDVEGAFDEQVAARVVDVARHAHEVAGRGGHAQRGELLLEGEAPLDGGGLGRGVQARRRADVFGGNVADLGRPVGVLALHRFHQLLVAVRPQVDELVVHQVLVDDGVEHGDAERAVGAGTHLQPDFGLGAQPRQTRVDGDDLRAHLHALDDPVPNEAVGVGLQRLVAPHHDDVGAAERGVGVAQLVRFRHVDDGHLAHLGRRADHARQVAGEPGEAEVAHVGRLQRG